MPTSLLDRVDGVLVRSPAPMKATGKTNQDSLSISSEPVIRRVLLRQAPVVIGQTSERFQWNHRGLASGLPFPYVRSAGSVGCIQKFSVRCDQYSECHHFPIQKLEKILPRISSTSILPVTRPSASEAYLSSSAPSTISRELSSTILRQ